jgi:hypothetical protein
VLRWRGLNEREQLHWCGVVDPDLLCACCWQGRTCPRHFAFRPQTDEILYGSIPVSSAVAQQLLRQARSWIDAQILREKPTGIKPDVFEQFASDVDGLLAGRHGHLAARPRAVVTPASHRPARAAPARAIAAGFVLRPKSGFAENLENPNVFTNPFLNFVTPSVEHFP